MLCDEVFALTRVARVVGFDNVSASSRVQDTALCGSERLYRVPLSSGLLMLMLCTAQWRTVTRYCHVLQMQLVLLRCSCSFQRRHMGYGLSMAAGERHSSRVQFLSSMHFPSCLSLSVQTKSYILLHTTTINCDLHLCRKLPVCTQLLCSQHTLCRLRRLYDAVRPLRSLHRSAVGCQFAPRAPSCQAASDCPLK